MTKKLYKQYKRASNSWQDNTISATVHFMVKWNCLIAPWSSSDNHNFWHFDYWWTDDRCHANFLQFRANLDVYCRAHFVKLVFRWKGIKIERLLMADFSWDYDVSMNMYCVVFVFCGDVQRVYQTCFTLVRVANTMHWLLNFWALLWKTFLISVIVGFHWKLSSCWPHSWWVCGMSLFIPLVSYFVWIYRSICVMWLSNLFVATGQLSPCPAGIYAISILSLLVGCHEVDK